MKKFLLLMLIAVSAFASPVLAQDTVVNNGDGKVVIIDKRPRTVYSVPSTKSNIQRDQEIAKLNRDLDNLYSYHETLDSKYESLNTEIDQIKMMSRLENYYHYKNKDDDKYSIANWVAATLCVGLLAWFIVWLLQRNYKCSCNCNCNQPQPPVINHFNVAGGSAVLDVSENMSNFQPHNHYHCRPLPAMIQDKPKEKTEEAAT
jgi:hypothetical protein